MRYVLFSVLFSLFSFISSVGAVAWTKTRSSDMSVPQSNGFYMGNIINLLILILATAIIAFLFFLLIRYLMERFKNRK